MTLSQKNIQTSRIRIPGFTLIELLTVIAIIGILASILLVVIGKVRDSSRTARCASNLRVIGQSVMLFATNNRGEVPSADIPAGARSTNAIFGGSSTWIGALTANSNEPGFAEAFLCPSLPDVRARWIALGTNGSAFNSDRVGTSTYSMNDITNTIGSAGTTGLWRLNVLKSPSNFVLISDGALTASTPANVVQHSMSRNRVNVVDGAGLGVAHAVDFRHGNRANVLFADGSVRAKPSEDILGTVNSSRWLP